MSSFLDSDDEEGTISSPLDGVWLEGDSLAPPCQSDMDIVDEIIKLAAPCANSVLFDLGCGDGRICLQASLKSSCRSAGCEIERRLFEKFEDSIIRLKLDHLVTAINGNLLDLELSGATIIVLYLLPESIELLKHKLVEAIRRGTILVCNTWGPKGLSPCSKVTCGQFKNVTLFKYDITSIERYSC